MAVGPPELGLDLAPPRETPAGWLALAYGLEENLRAFYAALAGRAALAAMQGLLQGLAQAEEGHKQRVAELYAALPPQERPAPLAAAAPAGVLEGGLTMEDLLEGHGLEAFSPAQALELAMSLETQAMDLYLRLAARSRDQAGRHTLFALAGEEKAHLQALGRWAQEHEAARAPRPA